MTSHSIENKRIKQKFSFSYLQCKTWVFFKISLSLYLKAIMKKIASKGFLSKKIVNRISVILCRLGQLVDLLTYVSNSDV